MAPPRVLHLSPMKVTFKKVFTKFQNRYDYTDFNQFFPLNTYAICEIPPQFLNSLIKHFILHLKLTVEFSHKFNFKKSTSKYLSTESISAELSIWGLIQQGSGGPFHRVSTRGRAGTGASVQ